MARLLLLVVTLAGCSEPFTPQDWVDQAYVATPGGDANLVEGFGARFGLWVTAARDTGLDVVVVPLDDEANQQGCYPTVETSTTALDAPDATFAPFDLRYANQGVVMTLLDVEVSGALRDDASGIDAVRMVGLMEVSSLEDVVGTPLCPVLEATGQTCESCPDGSGDDCWSFEWLDGVAETASLTPTVRTQTQIDADSDCE